MDLRCPQRMKDIKKFGMSTSRFYLPIYKAGEEVAYNGETYTIDMVYVSGEKVLLKLQNISELIDSSNVEISYLTRFEFERKYGN